MVGGALTSVVLLAFQSFRVAALLIAGQLATLLVWRLAEPDHSGAWYAIRKKWVDVAILCLLLLGVTVFAIWVPEPVK